MPDEVLFEGVKLGKREPRVDPRTLKFARYFKPEALPHVPRHLDLTAAVPSWPMYGNDSLGDCTCAAAGHMVQAWTTAAGQPRQPADDDVLGLYWATGKDDTGRFELDVLNYWRSTGLGGDKIAAYVQINPLHVTHMRAAIYLFGGVYVGVALPKTAQGQKTWDVVGDGKTGDSAPGSWGGHAVPYLAYDAASFGCVTWGATLELTDRFSHRYCDEAYAVLSTDWLDAHGESPAGFDLAALRADLSALAG